MKKVKKILLFLLSIIILAQPVTAFASVSIFEPSRGEFVKVKTIEQQGIGTMVPFRQMFECFGAAVSWDAKTETSSAWKNNLSVSVKIGEKTATVNGVKVNLATSAKMLDGKTYVPLSFITSLKGIISSGNLRSDLKIWEENVFIKNHGWTQIGGKLIAHAGGGLHPVINGRTVYQIYTNSMEAIENSYKNGFKVFEIDFNMTYDGKLAAVHEWANVGGKKTSEEWKNYKILDMYKAIFLEDVYKFMLKHKDAFLVTDTKSFHHTDENIKKQFEYIVETAKSTDESLLNRIIPQVYDQNCYKIMMDVYPFDSVIYTLYESYDSNKEIVNFVAKNDNIKVVTMSWDRYTKEFYNDLTYLSKYIYFFTINVHNEILTFKKWGVHGFYTDYIKP